MGRNSMSSRDESVQDLDIGYKFGYRDGRRRGIQIGAVVAIPLLVIAYIFSQSVMYLKWLK